MSCEAVSLPSLQIDRDGVVAVGFDHGADFAHQLHIAFSSMVSGSCLFAAQPFHCAATHFSQDRVEVWTPWTRVPNCDGCVPGTRMPFDHCKRDPDVVDVGALVDYPRRACGQNPISVPDCFDAVESFLDARVFVFRGADDDVYLPGAVENTVALLAQMITDPASKLKLVNDLPFGHALPVNATPFVNASAPAGYDGPGECLRHLYSPMALTAAEVSNASWVVFDQDEFADAGVGFQQEGWVYVPSACQTKECKLVVMADKCDPPTEIAPAAAEFARFAEGSGMVLLHPCVGGPVDQDSYPHATDVADGKLDVFGQLTSNYAMQGAPHMQAVGKMMRRLLGENASAVGENASAAVPPPESAAAAPAGAASALASEPGRAPDGVAPTSRMRLPTLRIDNASVATAGCSNTADFSHQFHVAFSSLVTASCVFSGQPYHCAVTRFPDDVLVPKCPSTAAGIHCDGCPEDGTLIYDHCKNHPHWVDVSTLAEYAESHPDVDDPAEHLARARAFVFGPTHDRCYQPPAMENVAEFYRRYADDPSQIQLVEDQPFPHTLPTNSTPYYNQSTPAGYDGPGECLRHIFGHAAPLAPAAPTLDERWRVVDQREFIAESSEGSGMMPLGWLLVPPRCEQELCKLLVLPGGCVPPFSGTTDDSTDAFARYAVANGIVILKPCAGPFINTTAFPQNHENLRGMVDVYGQLSPEYATQLGGQMQPIGAMIRRLMGLE